MTESRGDRPGLPVLTVSVDVKQHWTWTCITELRSCVKVEVTVLGGLCDRPGLPVLTVSVDVKQHWTWTCITELRSCVKVEVVVLGSQSLIVRTVSVDVKQHWTRWLDYDICCRRRSKRCCCWSLLYSAILRSRADTAFSLSTQTFLQSQSYLDWARPRPLTYTSSTGCNFRY